MAIPSKWAGAAGHRQDRCGWQEGGVYCFLAFKSNPQKESSVQLVLLDISSLSLIESRFLQFEPVSP